MDTWETNQARLSFSDAIELHDSSSRGLARNTIGSSTFNYALVGLMIGAVAMATAPGIGGSFSQTIEERAAAEAPSNEIVASDHNGATDGYDGPAAGGGGGSTSGAVVVGTPSALGSDQLASALGSDQLASIASASAVEYGVAPSATGGGIPWGNVLKGVAILGVGVAILVTAPFSLSGLALVGLAVAASVAVATAWELGECALGDQACSEAFDPALGVYDSVAGVVTLGYNYATDSEFRDALHTQVREDPWSVAAGIVEPLVDCVTEGNSRSCTSGVTDLAMLRVPVTIGRSATAAGARAFGYSNRFVDGIENGFVRTALRARRGADEVARSAPAIAGVVENATSGADGPSLGNLDELSLEQAGEPPLEAPDSPLMAAEIEADNITLRDSIEAAPNAAPGAPHLEGSPNWNNFDPDRPTYFATETLPIGSGTYHDVYRVTDPVSGTQLAIKVQTARRIDRHFQNRIPDLATELARAEALAEIGGPEVRGVVTFVDAAGRFHTGIAMELVDGSTVFDSATPNINIFGPRAATPEVQLSLEHLNSLDDVVERAAAQGLDLIDAHPQNFMATATGEIVPIDIHTTSAGTAGPNAQNALHGTRGSIVEAIPTETAIRSSDGITLNHGQQVQLTVADQILEGTIANLRVDAATGVPTASIRVDTADGRRWIDVSGDALFDGTRLIH